MRVILALTMLAAPLPALAQATTCRLPERIELPRPERAPADEARRVRPIAGYLLALSWSPQFCRDAAESNSFQCGGSNRFGFILHGLWPEAADADFPRWCRAVPPLPAPVIRRNLCVSPSPQLIQRQWAKHGSCAARDPADYLAASARLYRTINYPDMDILSRRPLTIAQFTTAFTRANPRLPRGAITVSSGRGNWLNDVRICLDSRFRPRACPAFARGRAGNTPLRIWRGGRGSRPL